MDCFSLAFLRYLVKERDHLPCKMKNRQPVSYFSGDNNRLSMMGPSGIGRHGQRNILKVINFAMVMDNWSSLLGMVVLLVLRINQSKLLPWSVMGVGKCRWYLIPPPIEEACGTWIHAQPRRRRSTAKARNQSSTRAGTSGSRFDILANSDLERLVGKMDLARETKVEILTRCFCFYFKASHSKI